MVRISNTIKERRTSMNLTLLDLSKLTGIPVPTISRFERGIMTPVVYKAQMLAKALGTTVEELFVIETGSIPEQTRSSQN